MSAAMVVATFTGSAGCAGSPASVTAAGHLAVELRDYTLSSDTTSIAAGAVTIDITNAGPTTHELVIDRTTLEAADLPLAADGVSVDESADALHRVTTVPPLRLGARHQLTVQLTPGHYVLYCNLAGHYLGAMRTGLDVVSRGGAA